MNKWIAVTIFTLLLASIVALPAGCTFFKKSSSSSSGSGAVSSEPLTSSWRMSRTSIDPSFPSMIPGFVVDQIIPKNPTWSITLSGSQIKATYDGRSTWFNPMGLAVNVKTPSISESTDKKSVEISGGGSIKTDRLPGPLALLGTVSDLTINYTDKITVTITSQDQISAVITYSASGKYTGSKGPDSFNNSATVKYTGTRK